MHFHPMKKNPHNKTLKEEHKEHHILKSWPKIKTQVFFKNF